MGDIIAVYQPVVDLHSWACVGYEALLRGKNMQLPEQLFAGLRGRGRRDLELAALRCAVADAPPGLLFVNVSPAVFGYKKGGPAREALAGIPPERVVVEIIEKLPVLETFEPAVPCWKEAGFRLAVDDLGGSDISLALVFLARPHFVKLARELVADLPRQDSYALSVIKFARHHNAEVIAEGIETIEQLEAARRVGIAWGQGYYLGRPAPAREIVSENQNVRVQMEARC